MMVNEVALMGDRVGHSETNQNVSPKYKANFRKCVIKNWLLGYI